MPANSLDSSAAEPDQKRDREDNVGRNEMTDADIGAMHDIVLRPTQLESEVERLRADREILELLARYDQWRLRKTGGEWRIVERRVRHVGGEEYRTNLDATPQ
jgi:hypothetical protein